MPRWYRQFNLIVTPAILIVAIVLIVYLTTIMTELTTLKNKRLDKINVPSTVCATVPTLRTQVMPEILRNSCSEQYAAYQTGNVNVRAGRSSLVTPIINCVLEQFLDFRKAEMAASAVILGLLPTILQSLGSTTAETSLLGLRRPGLAFLLAAGSPAVAFMKTGEFVETIVKFVDSAAQTKQFSIPDLDLGEFLSRCARC
ncbi:hypothetical protein SCUP515_05076 [Seiridium cupressi]